MADSLYEKKLLIVDDNKEDVSQLLYRTTQFHFSYEIAETLSSAYSSADRFHPDLILVDITLPFETVGGALAEFDRVLEFIHKYAATQAVIMLTGDLNQEHVKMAIAAGACEWIPKNKVVNDPEEFRKQLEDAFSNYIPGVPLSPFPEPMNDAQKTILRAVMDLRKDIVIMRTCGELSVIKAEKVALLASTAAKENELALAKTQAFARGEKATEEKYRRARARRWAAITVVLSGWAWTGREYLKGLYRTIFHH